MKRIFQIGLLFLAVIPVRAADHAVIKFSCGAEVELTAPAIEPGQVLLVRLLKEAPSGRVVAAFDGVDYELAKGEGSLTSFALVGLDLALEPGTYDLKLTVYLRDGRVEELKHPLLVRGREFPVRKLRVSQEFVTPPPEVEERIRREAELLRMVYGVTTKTWLGEGNFERPHPGESADNFGEKRIFNGVPRSAHSGLDIAASQGSPVRAANGGRVVLARDLYFSGKTVILDHGLGVFSVYCHFSELKVSRGQAVKRGEVIALVGSTGRSTGPHLHWAFRIRGSRVDPQAMLDIGLPQ
jgi:murein DD-endopeptidase MepM/ murein hydrolase activator NlpD